MMAFASEDAMRVRRITYKLRQNQASFDSFHLNLDDATELADLAQAMRFNTTVREVSLFCDFLDDEWIDEPLIWRLFRSIGGLPKLDRLVLDYIGSDGDELPVSLLCAALTQPSLMLKQLELSCVHLTGTEHDFQSFAEALGMLRLTKLHIYGSYLDEDMREGSLLMDPILEQIASIETLEDVLFTALELNSLGQVSSNALGRLLHLSPSLKNLVLGDFALDDRHMQAMSVALEEQGCLQELNIGCRLSKTGARALATMLRQNQNLEILHLHLFSLEHGDDEHEHWQIADALQDNRTLKRFSLYGTVGNVGPKTQHAFARILEQNFTLEELELQDEDADAGIQPKINMFLKLNAFGRDRLLSQSANREEWIRALLEFHDDFDCLFYLISLNPSIICLSTTEAPQTSRKRKR